MKRAFTAAWIGWIGWFVAWEGVALLDADKGDTLTEHVRALFAFDPRFQVMAALLFAWLPYHFFVEPRLKVSDPKPVPKPSITPLVEQIAITAGEIIPSVAVLELEGAQKRREVRERIKAKFNLSDKDAARRLVDELTPFGGIAEFGSDLILKGLPLERAVDTGLDWLIQIAYRVAKATGAIQ